MSLIPLPKNPKAEDLIPQLTQFDKRIATLEAQYTQAFGGDKERIAALETAVAEHQAGAVVRQQEMNRLKRDADHTKWRLRKRRI